MGWVKCKYCRREFWMPERWAYYSKTKAGQRVNFCRYNHMIAWEKGYNRKDGRQSQGMSRRVICRETGEVYPSAAAAARSLAVDPQVLRGSIYRGGSCAGYHWAYLEEQG